MNENHSPLRLPFFLPSDPLPNTKVAVHKVFTGTGGGRILGHLDMNLDSFQRVIYSSSSLTKSLTCPGQISEKIFQKRGGSDDGVQYRTAVETQ
jgi:hypothetical protein